LTAGHSSRRRWPAVATSGLDTDGSLAQAGMRPGHPLTPFFVSRIGGGRYQALADYARPSTAGRQHGVVLCGFTPQYGRPCRNCGPSFRGSGLDDYWRSPPTISAAQEPGGRDRDRRGTRASTNMGLPFPIAAKSRREGARKRIRSYKWAAEARPKDVPRLELSQISDRPRWLHRRGRTPSPSNHQIRESQKPPLGRALAEDLNARSSRN